MPVARNVTMLRDQELQLSCFLVPEHEESIDYCRWIQPSGFGLQQWRNFEPWKNEEPDTSYNTASHCYLEIKSTYPNDRKWICGKKLAASNTDISDILIPHSSNRISDIVISFSLLFTDIQELRHVLGEWTCVAGLAGSGMEVSATIKVIQESTSNSGIPPWRFYVIFLASSSIIAAIVIAIAFGAKARLKNNRDPPPKYDEASDISKPPVMTLNERVWIRSSKPWFWFTLRMLITPFQITFSYRDTVSFWAW